MGSSGAPARRCVVASTPSTTGISMSITTASGEILPASSIASRPLRACPATVNRLSCSSSWVMTPRNDSSSSATRIRNGRASFDRLLGEGYPWQLSLGLERRLEVGPERLGILEPGAEPEQARRHAVALPAPAALDRRRHAAERARVDDHVRRGLDLPCRLGVRDVEGEQAAQAGITDGLDRRMVPQPLREEAGGLGLPAHPKLERLQDRKS